MNLTLNPTNYTGTQKRWTFLAGSFFFWTLIAAIFTTKTNLYYTLNGVSTSWLHLSIHHLAFAWTWVIFTPLMYQFYKKVLQPRGNIVKTGLILAVVTPFAGIVHSVGSLALDAGFRKYMGYIDGSIWVNLKKMDSIVVSGVFDSALVFLLIIGFFFGMEALRSRRDNRKQEAAQAKCEDRIMVKNNGQYVFVEPSRLMAITAEGNYVKLHMTGEKPLMVRETMTTFMARLNELNFVRVNRSFIANLGFVKSLHHKFNGEYTLVLNDGMETTTSKRYGDSWKTLLKD